MVLKTITHVSCFAGIQSQKVVGIFSAEKLESAIEDIKKAMEQNPKNVLISEKKDCCNCFLEYDNGGEGTDAKEHFYSGSYILNDLDL